MQGQTKKKVGTESDASELKALIDVMARFQYAVEGNASAMSIKGSQSRERERVSSLLVPSRAIHHLFLSHIIANSYFFSFLKVEMYLSIPMDDLGL